MHLTCTSMTRSGCTHSAEVARDIIAEVLFRAKLHARRSSRSTRYHPHRREALRVFPAARPSHRRRARRCSVKAGFDCKKEAAVRNAVRLVVELLRGDGVKIAQDGFFQNLRMELRHAVHRVAADHGEIRHAHEAAADDGGRLLTVVQPGTDWSKLSRQRRSISSMIWNWRGRRERMSDTGHFSSASGMTVWFV